MIFYMAMATLFWCLAFAPTRWAPLADKAALVLFIGIAGLRYNTGFDWLVYDHYFRAVAGKACYEGPAFEALFWLLNAPLASMTSNVAALFFTISLLNGIVLYSFCRRFGTGFALPAAIIFCWVYLPLHMSVLRQSLAVSGFLMAIAAVHGVRAQRATIAAIIGFGFQYSAIIYMPVLFARRLRVIWRHLPWILLACVMCSFFLHNPMQLLLGVMADLNLPFISQKLAIYRLLEPAVPSVASFFYMAVNVMFLMSVWYHHRARPFADSDWLLLLPLLMMVIAQTCCPDFPLIWNRIQYLAIPCQAVFIARHLPSYGRLRVLIVCALACLSMAVLTYQLNNPFMKPFYPYLSIFDNEDDAFKNTLNAEEYYKNYETKYDLQNKLNAQNLKPLPRALKSSKSPQNLKPPQRASNPSDNAKQDSCAQLAPSEVLNYLRD